MKGKKMVLILWTIFVFLPIFTLRLFQDEMLYMLMSMRASNLQFLPRSSLVFLFTSPLAAVGDVDLRVLLLRSVTALVTLVDLVLVYELARKRFGERAAFLSSITLLLSFVVLRYGGRYTLEPWGVLFILLALHFLSERPMLSALSLGLAFAARETWLTTYPFFLLYVWKTQKKEFWRFVVVSAIPVVLNFLFIYSINLNRSPLGYNSRILSSWSLQGLLKLAAPAWVQFAIAFPLTVLGFIYALHSLKDRLEMILVALPSVLTLNVVFGFLLNGPFERYTFGPLALMSIYSGYGLIEFYESVSRRLSFLRRISLERWVAISLIFQILALNVAVVELSNIGAKGIQDYGYWYDKEVFEVLEKYGGQEESFGGTPHPPLLGFKNWTWADRRLERVLNKSPDWLVTFRSWVKIDSKAIESGAVETWTSGPYIIIHARKEGAIKEYVIPTNFTLWGSS